MTWGSHLLSACEAQSEQSFFVPLTSYLQAARAHFLEQVLHRRPVMGCRHFLQDLIPFFSFSFTQVEQK